MLPSARWQLALIYSNSGKLTKTLVLTEITEFGRNLSLHCLFSSFLQLKIFICFIRLWLFHWRNYKKNNISLQRRTVLPDKGNYAEHRDYILVLKYVKLIQVQDRILTFFISYSGIKNKSLMIKLCYFFLFAVIEWLRWEQRSAWSNNDGSLMTEQQVMVILKRCR